MYPGSTAQAPSRGVPVRMPRRHARPRPWVRPVLQGLTSVEGCLRDMDRRGRPAFVPLPAQGSWQVR
jgi:hypothetical protein